MSKRYHLFVIAACICLHLQAYGQDSISYSNKKKIEELRSRIDKLYTMENNCDSLVLKLKQLIGQQEDSIKLLANKLSTASEGGYNGFGGNSNRIYYDVEKVKANYSSYLFLDSIASVLKKDPSLTIKLVGHADKTGPEAFNKRLSLRRAENLKNYLLNKYHLSPDKIVAEGKGSSESIKGITDPYLFHLNRRVEVFVEKSQRAELLLSE